MCNIMEVFDTITSIEYQPQSSLSQGGPCVYASKNILGYQVFELESKSGSKAADSEELSKWREIKAASLSQ